VPRRAAAGLAIIFVVDLFRALPPLVLIVLIYLACRPPASACPASSRPGWR
jgi:ABC-type amino acid transport system permease subunit